MPNDSPDSRPSWRSSIELTAIIIAASTGLLYLMGEAMHRGFLRAFGIGHEIMAITTTEAIAKGFRVFFPDFILFIVIGWLLFGFAVLALYWIGLATAAGMKYVSTWMQNKAWFKPTIKQRVSTLATDLERSMKQDSGLSDVSRRVANAVLLIGVFFIIAWYIGSRSFDRGEIIAIDMKHDCHPNTSVYQVYGFLTGWVDIDLFEIQSNEKTTLSGCVVYAGERYVAIYTPGETIKTRVVAIGLVREIRPVPLGG